MEILAGNLRDVAGQFLHAGYLSVSPRTYQPLIQDQQPDVLLDVEKATALQIDDTVASTIKGIDTGSAPVGILGEFLMQWWPELTLLLIFVTIILAYVPKQTYSPLRPHLYRWSAAGLGLIGLLLYIGFSPPVNATKSQVVFKHPKLATQYIIHAQIGDALASRSHPKTRTLRQLSNFRAHPIKKINRPPGMTSAMLRFGQDAWGNKIKMKFYNISQYQEEVKVTSAGKDGRFNTQDDISETFNNKDRDNFEPGHRGFYLTRFQGKLAVLFRAPTQRQYVFQAKPFAKKISGNNHFDALKRIPPELQKIAETQKVIEEGRTIFVWYQDLKFFFSY